MIFSFHFFCFLCFFDLVIVVLTFRDVYISVFFYVFMYSYSFLGKSIILEFVLLVIFLKTAILVKKRNIHLLCRSGSSIETRQLWNSWLLLHVFNFWNFFILPSFMNSFSILFLFKKNVDESCRSCMWCLYFSTILF